MNRDLFSWQGLTSLALALAGIPLSLPAASSGGEHPNILWITSEDNGPELGCYGDSQAITPRLDALASRSLRYLHCSSNAPVCAPARTTVITGLYPPSMGAEHMRSEVPLPKGFKMFPAYLREAGYFTSNRTKTDYNCPMVGDPWTRNGDSESHWRARQPGQPFFSVFNIATCHESRIRDAIQPENQVHDPATMHIPGYHPDTPEVRQDWAQYHDRLTMMDRQVGALIDQLEADSLTADTIIFYWADHGSGMPRHKRSPYHGGLHVPLIVHVPDKWLHLAPKNYIAGGSEDRLVAFIDFAPTVLSVAGIKPQSWMQGLAFMGANGQSPRSYNYGFRGRMDERIDCVRTVSDQRYHYIRNFMPHRPHGQHVAYMFQTPTTRIWKSMHESNALNPTQAAFWERRVSEELYELESDPEQINNLADDPQHAATLARLRKAQQTWAQDINDIGLLPEHEIHAQSKSTTPYELARSQHFDIERVFAAADCASAAHTGAPAWKTFEEMLSSEDSGVRYWGATAHLVHGQRAETLLPETNLSLLRDTAASDSSPAVRAVAAEALGHHGDAEDLALALGVLVEVADPATTSAHASLLAVIAFDALDEKALPIAARLSSINFRADRDVPARAQGYASMVMKKALEDLGRRDSE
jgi:uncharacterized sulfatase